MMKMNYRRSILKDVPSPKDQEAHAGLWLDKFLPDSGDESKKDLVNSASKIPVSDVYNRFFLRWSKALAEQGADCRKAHTLGRLVVNLGAESVLETSIALHHTYGVPYIPGSALKGLAAHYLLKYPTRTEWSRGSEAFRTLFGEPTSSGYVTFFDALYIPGSGHPTLSLWPDVITVHHPNYYQGNQPPADWDSPVPIHFLTASGAFLVALSGPKEWVNAAYEILALALAREGIGAKTSSGYGRMLLDSPSPETGQNTEFPAQKKNRLLKEQAPNGRFRGTLTAVQNGGRQAMINPARGGAQMFVHISQVTPSNSILHDGQVVEYQIGKFQGRNQAQEVVILL